MRRLTIISGGQTGADRGALEAARDLSIPTAGFCPRNYRTETGPDLFLKSFGLVPTKTRNYQERTEENVKSADAVIVFRDTRSAGSNLTIRLARQYRKRLLILDSCGPWTPHHLAGSIRRFLAVPPRIHALMIAGNRESLSWGITGRVREIMTLALS